MLSGAATLPALALDLLDSRSWVSDTRRFLKGPVRVLLALRH